MKDYCNRVAKKRVEKLEAKIEETLDDMMEEDEDDEFLTGN